MATNNNPLNLPLGPTGQPHQLWLQRPTEQDAGRRIVLCTPVLNYIATTGATSRFNALERPYQIASLLILEEEGSFARIDAFIRAMLHQRQQALYSSEHRDENVAIMYQEARLGHIAEFINYRRGLGFLEILSPTPVQRVGQAGVMADPEDRGGRYDQAYLSRKM